jgi:hypothetical protein
MSDRGVPYPGRPEKDVYGVYREESRDSRGGGSEAVTFASDTS